MGVAIVMVGVPVWFVLFGVSLHLLTKKPEKPENDDHSTFKFVIGYAAMLGSLFAVANLYDNINEIAILLGHAYLSPFLIFFIGLLLKIPVAFCKGVLAVFPSYPLVLAVIHFIW